MQYNYTKDETLLEVKDLSFTIDGNEILNNINFSVQDIHRPGVIQGQVLSIVGKSGIGKSTLLNCLSGICKPTTGSIVIEEKINTHLGEMGVVFQDYYIYPWRRVSKVLYLATIKNPLIKETDRKAEVEKIVTEFNLGEHLNKFPCQLSGGQRQRVAIAEQILNGSEFLLLDEPFSGLDLIMLEKVFDTLIKVSMLDEKKTIIIISHDLSNCMALSDTVHILNKPNLEKGATIVKTIDLAERGLAWTPGVKDLPAFRETLNEVKTYMR
jgi:polar amino acid transport system ATP-binding protein/sulfate transport system ATP-binding protein/NitT/TauT family transport system ATP-binding protein